MRRILRKRTAVAVSVVAMLAVAGAAFAYFSSTGSGTGSAHVGSSTAFTVAVSPGTGGPLYPGAGSESLAYTITNPSTGGQNLSATAVSMVNDGSGNIVSGGAAVSGCKVADFHPVDVPPAYGNMLGGSTKSGSVTVTMSDSGFNQDACQGKTPDVKVDAS
jgi:hypothetical protein